MLKLIIILCGTFVLLFEINAKGKNCGGTYTEYEVQFDYGTVDLSTLLH